MSLSLCLFASLSGRPRRFLAIIKAQTIIVCSTCGRRTWVPHYNLYSSNLSPHWGPKGPNGVQSSLYAHLSVSLSGRPCHFLVIICMASNCVQHMRPQAMGSNPLSGSIICMSFRPSLRLVIHRPFVVFYLYWFLVWRSSAVMHLYVCLSICLSFSLSLCLVVRVAFWR